MLTIIEGLPDRVIGIRITDKLRAEDYETQLIPLVNEKLASHPRLDLLCCIDGEWKGMEAGAVWQDLRLGLGKIGHWARMAIVTDIGWMENAISCSGCFRPVNFGISAATITRLPGHGSARPSARASTSSWIPMPASWCWNPPTRR
jgi:hypothetical protein